MRHTVRSSIQSLLSRTIRVRRQLNLTGGSARPAAFAHGGTDELTYHLGHTRVHLGLNTAATAVPIASEEAGDNAHTSSEDVVLYFDIIDILQEYNMPKRFEHSFKSLSHDGSTISAVNPRAYANRFQDFVKKVVV